MAEVLESLENGAYGRGRQVTGPVGLGQVEAPASVGLCTLLGPAAGEPPRRDPVRTEDTVQLPSRQAYAGEPRQFCRCRGFAEGDVRTALVREAVAQALGQGNDFLDLPGAQAIYRAAVAQLRHSAGEPGGDPGRG